MSPSDGMFLPFHEDELRAQALAGQRATRAAIRPSMPDQHREFFPLLRYLFTATLDEVGAPLASVVSGPAGFVRSPDPTTLLVAAMPSDGDPAADGFAAGRPIGLLGLDLTTRRRNRANGYIQAVDTRGLAIIVRESFGNCAQYIQTRTPVPHPRSNVVVEPLSDLDDRARSLIGSSDTFFVASRAREALGTEGRLDISHRGGRPGFVTVERDTLVIPDFRGNRYFNTLGNLLGDPRAGLLFIDFDSGEVLQLQGKASIGWTAPNSEAFGAQRSWRLSIERGWRRRAAFPFDWTFGEYAPTTLASAQA